MNKKENITLISIVSGGILLDQITKLIAIDTLKGMGRYSYLGDTFRLEYTENTGAFLGMGSNLPDSVRFTIFSVVVGIFLLALLVYLFKGNMPRPQRLAFAFVASGGVSNLIDRVFRENGGVVDFLNVGIGSLRTGIFNIADMFILFAVIFLFYTSYQFEKKSKKK